ncbi:MAG: choice-of-anchor X domain-containing protein, partial [Vicinamibacteria bacterium]
ALAAAAGAQTAREVPLANRVYDPFELTAAAPVYTYNLDIPDAAEVVLDVHTPAGVVDVEVRNPLGAVVPPASFTVLTLAPDQVPPLGAALYEAGRHVQLVLTNPPTGVWTVRVTLPAGAPDVYGTLSAFMTGGLGVSVLTSRPEYAVGDTVTLGVVAFDGAGPVAGASVTANVYQEGQEGSPTVVTLVDDGNPPDAQADDGLYSARLTLLPAGSYLVEAVLQSGPRRAVAGASFEVEARLARFTGAASDQGADTNGDGLFEQVELSLGVEVDDPGSYSVQARLSAPDGRTLSAGAPATLAAGPGAVVVPFAASAIKTFLAADGPWTIDEAVLTRLDADSLPVRVSDVRRGLGLTGPYTLAQLQRPITVIPPGLTDAGLDTDADGLFDLLRVRFQIDTRQAGGYTWTGDLRAPDGAVLGVATGSAFLDAGVSTVEFLFPGLPIGQSGQNGPYTVGNVAAYGPPDAAAVVDELGLTQPYQVTQFEGSVQAATFAQLIQAVQTVPISSGFPPASVLRKVLLLTVQLARLAAETGHEQAARVLLSAFVDEVRFLETRHRIAPADADRLADLAERLADQL